MDMTAWIRYRANGKVGFGTLEGETISEHAGNMYEGAKPTGQTLALSSVEILAPSEPTKVIALWNNFHELAAKLKVAEPAEPLYLMKANTSITSPDATVTRPKSYTGKVVYEGELGIVIGKPLKNASEAEAAKGIFGYTVVNDITAAEIIQKDPTFAQWVRAKSFDEFCPFGPVIATGLDASKLSVRLVLNGEERQNYKLSDMIFPPAKLVSMISHDMTLLPGDLIAVGTSLGVGTMKDPTNTVSVTIEGIGTLTNTFVN
jgi:2-keto-4-pentenoate hydratase/2-oxohepta-3-ene-1,7-dioic acid hydratase in catechol pathway